MNFNAQSSTEVASGRQMCPTALWAYPEIRTFELTILCNHCFQSSIRLSKRLRWPGQGQTMCPCVCACVSLASDSSETIEFIITTLGTVIATYMLMRHMFIILTLTSILGHADLHHENNKCSIISETVQAIPITFAVKIFRLKVYIIMYRPDGHPLHSRSQLRLKLDKCLACTVIAIFRTVFKL